MEWEYLPHIGPRPPKGFVGLKNAGATCYMNSVLQQLYMIPPIRDPVLKLDEAAQDLVRQTVEEDKKEAERPVNKPTKNEVITVHQAEGGTSGVYLVGVGVDPFFYYYYFLIKFLFNGIQSRIPYTTPLTVILTLKKVALKKSWLLSMPGRDSLQGK